MEKWENIVIFYYLVGVNRKREKKVAEVFKQNGMEIDI